MKTLLTPQHPVDRMFRAFSDRTRLRILHLVHAGEMCVGDLRKVIRAPQPTISRHLAYLRRAGLVRSRKDGAWSYYSLAEPRTEFHRKLLDCAFCCLGGAPQFKSDAKRRETVRRKGACCPATKADGG